METHPLLVEGRTIASLNAIEENPALPGARVTGILGRKLVGNPGTGRSLMRS